MQFKKDLGRGSALDEKIEQLMADDPVQRDEEVEEEVEEEDLLEDDELGDTSDEDETDDEESDDMTDEDLVQDEEDEGGEVAETEDGKEAEVVEPEEEPATAPETEAVQDIPGETDPEKVYPLLLRLAEARRDGVAVAQYKEEFESAKDRKAELQAMEVLKRVEEGARTGGLYAPGGLSVGTITDEVYSKIAMLLGGEISGDEIIVPVVPEDEHSALLQVTKNGAVTVSE